QPRRTSSLVPWIVAGAALLLATAVGFGALIVTLASRQSSTNATKNPNSTPTQTQNAVVNLAGTRWTQTSTIRQIKEFNFNSSGIINSDPHDTWRQNGNQLIMEITDGYAHYEGTIDGNRIDYKAHNRVNLDWTGTLYRVQ